MKIKLTTSASLPTRIVFTDASSPLPDFEAKKETTTTRYEGTTTIIYAGTGEASLCTPAIIRTAAATALQRAVKLKRDRVSLIRPSRALHWTREHEIAALEGALLGADAFTKYKSDRPVEVSLLEVSGSSLTSSDIKQVETICAAVTYARDLVNENASLVYPQVLANKARDIARASRMKLTVLTEKEITARGLGLLEAVGRGSPYPPRLVMMEYTGDPHSRDKTAIIGKGITFDSGGLNLKPSGSIEDMKGDMAGAAAVLGVMRALGTLKPKINVVGVIASAHNAIDGASYFPGDVYRSLKGTTVEITNTDAEGRLVLADALTYCQRHAKPTRIIDLATLTGGILTALGDSVAGLFANDDGLAASLFDAGETTNERVWRFPIYEEHEESIKSDAADLRNTSKFKKGYASSITGAAFIKHFVEDIPWAHIDIAGTAWNANDVKGEVPKYATGFGVRLVMRFLTPD